MSDLDIAQVAKATGVPASTLRFYEEKGLIRSHGRRGLRRLYDPSVRERLALIALGRACGFSLDEIGEMFAEGGPSIDRARLTAKADALEAQMRQLQVMSTALRHAAACPAPSHAECPHFRQIVMMAGQGQAEAALRKPFVAEAL